MFGLPTEKSRKNASNLLLNFKTNPKVLVHPNLKKFTTPLPHIAKITYHYNIAKIIFQNPHKAKKSQTSLAIQMEPHPRLKGSA